MLVDWARKTHQRIIQVLPMNDTTMTILGWIPIRIALFLFMPFIPCMWIYRLWGPLKIRRAAFYAGEAKRIKRKRYG